MKTTDLDFILINKGEEYPYELLLLADETKYAINKYLFDSVVYLVKIKESKVAVFCLYELDQETVEIKNIAVSEHFQHNGIGSLIISFIKALSKDKYSAIIVGTAECAVNQIRFYEKNGFKKFDSRKNFFIENYTEPIIENGIQLKHMVLLKYKFRDTTRK